MSGDTLQILIAMVSYMAIVIVIGLIFAKKANKSSENYFLGGRSLGPWVTAMSAEASDMSGWLLMGLPGVARPKNSKNPGISCAFSATAEKPPALIVLITTIKVRATNITIPCIKSDALSAKKPPNIV